MNIVAEAYFDVHVESLCDGLGLLVRCAQTRATELAYTVERALDTLGDPVIESDDAFTRPRPKAG